MEEGPLSRALIVFAAMAGCRQPEEPGVLRFSGHVEATEVRISTKSGGTLSTLEVQEGDRVDSGQMVARFDTTDAELARAAARAERAAAEANLRLLLAGAREEDLRAAEAELERAGADLENAERDLKRMEDLLASGSGFEKSRDDARLRRDVAARNLEVARETLAKLRAGARREEIDATRARLQAAEARLAQIDQQMKDATVMSPLSGVVTEKLVEPGEILAPRTALLVVSDLNHAWLNIYVGDQDLPAIRIGQPAEVTTDAGPERYPGKVTFIASQAEFTPKNVQTRDERLKLVYKVKVALDNTKGVFKPGMPAETVLQPQS